MNDQKSKRELEHHFKLYEKQPLEVDDEGTLHINFVYQLMLKVPNQKTLRNQAYAKILEQLPVEYKELTKEVDEKITLHCCCAILQLIRRKIVVTISFIRI